MTNNGSISIASDTEELAGAVGGAGSFSLINRQSSVRLERFGRADHQRGGADALILEKAQSFAATISGFGTGDTIDATNFRPARNDVQFRREFGGHGRHAHAERHECLTANILMTGDYSNSDFTLAPDSGTGTLVKFA